MVLVPRKVRMDPVRRREVFSDRLQKILLDGRTDRNIALLIDVSFL